MVLSQCLATEFKVVILNSIVLEAKLNIFVYEIKIIIHCTVANKKTRGLEP